MLITRIWEDEHGVSHFGDLEVELFDSGEIGRLSMALPAASLVFRETPGDYDFDWHPAPSKQFILMLEGGVEIEVGDGEVRVFDTGDVVLVEDTTGRGHRSRAVDGRPRRSVFIQVP